MNAKESIDDPPIIAGSGFVSGLVERLRRQAVGSSQASKIIAESKAGDYEWALPEQTLEAEAAALIEQLVEALEEAVCFVPTIQKTALAKFTAVISAARGGSNG